MPTQEEIYKTEGDKYEALIAREDYQGNILDVFKKAGFKDVTSSVNLRTGSGLKRGDVLLRTGHHVAMYCGHGKEVEASINEKGKATGGKPGDQTGREILIRSYRNYPWNHVLRYTETASVNNNTSISHGKLTASNKTRFKAKKSVTQKLSSSLGLHSSNIIFIPINTSIANDSQ